MKARAAALLAALAGCGEVAMQEPQPPDLESAAIERGLVRDPDSDDPTGLYARDGDRLCLVAQGKAHRIGVIVNRGAGARCNAKGGADASGGAMQIDLGRGCRFDARYDDQKVVFPLGHARCVSAALFGSSVADRFGTTAT